MTTPPDDAPKVRAEMLAMLNDLRLALTEVRGELKMMNTKIDAGDKQSEQLVALVKPRIDALDRGLSENTSELRTSLQNHSHEDAPHDRSLGVRIGALERALAKQQGALYVLGFAVPVVTALAVKYVTGA